MTVSESSVLDTEVLVGGSAMPNERPGPMEPQSLSQMPEGFPRRSTVANGVRSRASRRFFVVGGALLLSSFAIYEMGAVFSIGGITPLEYLMLALFAINFCWIALAFCSGIAGFLLLLKKPKPNELAQTELHTRTAILMPTYNESPDRVFSAVSVMAEALSQTGHGHAFDWFILSDTTDPEIALLEERFRDL